jgi:short subunit dehydrogenase-like uncharacterized protein
MNLGAHLDIVIYGATGFTGRLVAEHFHQRYGTSSDIKWAMAGRSLDKLRMVREEIGASEDVPLFAADASDTASVEKMVEQTKSILTTVGPYQFYGSGLVAACAAAGTDYLDLSGESHWMRHMLDAHEATAKKTGARILFSCGFDSIPFELGVYFAQESAKEKFGKVVPRVKGRVRKVKGSLSGGTIATGTATMSAAQKDPNLVSLLIDPFALTPGFRGPEQPRADKVELDPHLNMQVGPFIMAPINTKNIHRSNLLQGHAYGADFVYDEMSVMEPATQSNFDFAQYASRRPGEGPNKEEQEAGYYDLLFIGLSTDARQIRVGVKGAGDPGYGSTSKIIAETAICLLQQGKDVAPGIWMPGAALKEKLVARLQMNAGLRFLVEAASIG